VDDNIAKIIAGLVVAAIGAQTFVAYKHPRAYVLLGSVLSLIGTVCIIGIASWNLSNDKLGYAILSSGLIGDKSSEVKNIMQRLAISDWWTLALASWSFYHVFLLSFPYWLLEPDQK
jgi:hypothetical protein